MVDETEQNTGQGTTEITLDDLFNQGVDDSAIQQANKELLLPVGTWTTVPPFVPRITKEEKTGRHMIRFWGTVTLGDTTGKIGFRMSPDRKNALDRETGEDTGKPDFPYRLFLQAHKAYAVAYNEPPGTVGDVVKYVSEYPIRLRIIQTQSLENMVVTISPLRSV